MSSDDVIHAWKSRCEELEHEIEAAMTSETLGLHLLSYRQAADKVDALAGRYYGYRLFHPEHLDSQGHPYPFYVGIGTGRRVFSHEAKAEKEDRLKAEVIRNAHKQGFELLYTIDAMASQNAAWKWEAAEIAFWGRLEDKSGRLVNLTAGGAGTRGKNIANRGAYGERGIANRFYLDLNEESKSPPIKAHFIPGDLANHPKRPRKKPTRRQAAALMGTAIANKKILRVGARLPRKLHLQTEEGIRKAFYIEQGASASILELGLATLEHDANREEIFVLTQLGLNTMLDLIGRDKLSELGLISTD